MEDDLSRAQHYRALAAQLHDSAGKESDEDRRKQLLDLADQYGRLADKLVNKHQ